VGVTVREKPKGSGIWWVFVNYHGRRKSRRLGTKDAATLFAAKVVRELAEDDQRVFKPAPAPPPVVAVPTFGPFAQMWLARHATLGGRPSTHTLYASAVRHHLVPYFGDRPVGAISATDIEDFIVHLRTRGSVRFAGKGLRDEAVRSVVAVLGLVLKRAVREKVITASPMPHVEWGIRRREARPDPDPFQPHELRAVVAAARELDPDAAVLFELWARTGARAGEIAGLRWEDIDLDAGLVWIRRTLSRGRVGPTKTGKGRRVSFGLPILEDGRDWRPSAAVVSALATRVRALRRRALDPTAPLFLSPSGGAWPTASLSLVSRRAVAKAGVRYRVAETLRHTMASIELSRGAPPLFVQRQGGWSSATVLFSTYATWIEQGADSAAPAAHPAQTDQGLTS
jgi:integrase